MCKRREKKRRETCEKRERETHVRRETCEKRERDMYDARHVKEIEVTRVIDERRE